MEGYLHDLQRGLYSLTLSWDGSEAKWTCTAQTRSIWDPDRIARDSEASIIVVRQKFRNRGGSRWKNVARWRQAQELNDQRQMMAAEVLRRCLSELRKHGSGSGVVIAPAGELGDWTVARRRFRPRSGRRYIVLLNRLKEDYLLDRSALLGPPSVCWTCLTGSACQTVARRLVTETREADGEHHSCFPTGSPRLAIPLYPVEKGAP
jgi:hypothetical protein